jgi:hypothetical protein
MKALLDQGECRRRDAELRTHFADGPAGLGTELGVTRSLVIDGHPELAAYPLVVAHEWEPVPGASQYGKGDLVFADGRGNFAVVEVKFIDLLESGRTVGTRRTGHRKKVREQARFYAAALQTCLGTPAAAIRAFAHTNEDPMAEVTWTE